MSPNEIATKLGLPLEKVNGCFMILRQAGKGSGQPVNVPADR